MFADDAVILSDSIEGLQSSLNYLEMFCIKWNLTVNIDKTKIVVFRWTYAGVEIEKVSSFNYVGFVLSSEGHLLRLQIH